MKNIRIFYLKFFSLEVKFSIYLNRRVLVMAVNLKKVWILWCLWLNFVDKQATSFRWAHKVQPSEHSVLIYIEPLSA